MKTENVYNNNIEKWKWIGTDRERVFTLRFCICQRYRYTILSPLCVVCLSTFLVFFSLQFGPWFDFIPFHLIKINKVYFVFLVLISLVSIPTSCKYNLEFVYNYSSKTIYSFHFIRLIIILLFHCLFMMWIHSYSTTHR